MPFYEYECSNCRFYVEVLQKISEQPLKKCPSCGKNALKKLVSAPVFRLKGSGWYETDFKSDQEGKRNLAGADKEEAASDKKETKGSGDAKAESKTDSKAESKAETKTESKSDAKPEPKASTGGDARRGSRQQSKPAAKPAPKPAAKPAAKAKPSKGPAAKSKPAAKRRRGR
jgi:putative FmdB family regulatory protein